jgi:hypothetical protein
MSSTDGYVRCNGPSLGGRQSQHISHLERRNTTELAIAREGMLVDIEHDARESLSLRLW